MKKVILVVAREDVDIREVIEVTRPGERAEIMVRGVATGVAQVKIAATIDFKRGAKDAMGNIDMNVMTLSRGARVALKPVILSNENSATGRHGAVSGRFDDDMVKYLCSRGYGPSRAREGLIRAKLWEGVGTISDAEERKRAEKWLEMSLTGVFDRREGFAAEASVGEGFAVDASAGEGFTVFKVEEDN